MNNNICLNLLIYLTFVVVLIKVVPVLASVLREIKSLETATPSKRLFFKVKLGALLGMLAGSSVVVIGTIFGSARPLTTIGGSIFFLCLAGSGYCDIRLNQIETKLTAWGGIILFSAIGISLFVWSIIQLLSY